MTQLNRINRTQSILVRLANALAVKTLVGTIRAELSQAERLLSPGWYVPATVPPQPDQPQTSDADADLAHARGKRVGRSERGEVDMNDFRGRCRGERFPKATRIATAGVRTGPMLVGSFAVRGQTTTEPVTWAISGSTRGDTRSGNSSWLCTVG